MKRTVHVERDRMNRVAYIAFVSNCDVARSIMISGGEVVLDFDEHGRLVGLEVLNDARLPAQWEMSE